MDGGSTDGTVEVLRQYSNRIRWVSEPDKGHADAIDKGWRMSGGEGVSYSFRVSYMIIGLALMSPLQKG